MHVTFDNTFSLTDKKDWLNKRIMNCENRIVRLKELNVIQEIIDGELRTIARCKEDLEELNK
jgi:hypothetical protein